ncbi:MAG: DUF1501 domain-containing protein [Planctomycetes bacterium]|nr:DUF1501 domain-containing protein [Planctomycetota bacterium]
MRAPHDLLTRRHFLGQAGLGAIALRALLADEQRLPHFAPRAKNVIWLFMAGAPSQLDLFEPKPVLQRHHGQPVPAEYLAGQRFAFLKGTPNLLGSPFRFAPRGQCGAQVSELLPHHATIVDHVAWIRSLHTDHFNHGPAQIFMNTGHTQIGRPSCGAWVSYGLGSAARDLPGFVVLVSGKIDPGAGSACWSSGFLPTHHQGVELRSKGEPVPCVQNPTGVDSESRRRTIDLVTDLDRERLAALGDPDIAARIAAYELAFRMQSSVPELVDLDREPAAVHALYGTEPGRNSFANNCLMARRLVERGTRFVQLYHRGWDHHGTDRSDDLLHGLPNMCRQTDRAATALVLDLQRRGLLDETLVVWAGEFGRTPMQEVRNAAVLGRDHHRNSFTIWLAGGGVKPGASVGATDELGYHVTEQPVHVNDLHATMLHLLGLDHERLVHRFQGRDYRLTDVAGKVVRQVLA